jgi:hypothetical protein
LLRGRFHGPGRPFENRVQKLCAPVSGHESAPVGFPTGAVFLGRSRPRGARPVGTSTVGLGLLLHLAVVLDQLPVPHVTIVIQGNQHIGKAFLTHVLIALPAKGKHVRSAVGATRCVSLTVPQVQRVHAAGVTANVGILPTTHTHSVGLAVRVSRKASQHEHRCEQLTAVRATGGAVIRATLVGAAVVSGDRGGGGDHCLSPLCSSLYLQTTPLGTLKPPIFEILGNDLVKDFDRGGRTYGANRTLGADQTNRTYRIKPYPYRAPLAYGAFGFTRAFRIFRDIPPARVRKVRKISGDFSG